MFGFEGSYISSSFILPLSFIFLTLARVKRIISCAQLYFLCMLRKQMQKTWRQTPV